MKILIIDDHTLFRSGMVHLLENLDPKPEIVESHSLQSAQEYLSGDNHVDLVLLDLRLGDTTGLDGLTTLRGDVPDIPIIVLSAELDPAVIQRCIEYGAMGFITKCSTHDELLDAIRLINAGGIYLPPAAREGQTAPANYGSRPSDIALLASLSKRQREVLMLLVQGKPNKTISTLMDISQNTVKAHLSAIFRVLGARNRTEAVYFAARAGVPLDCD